MSRVKITRQAGKGLTVTTLAGPELTEIYATLTHAGPAESPAAVVRRLAALLRQYRAAVVKLDAFGAPRRLAAYSARLRSEFGAPAWPFTRVTDGAGTGAGLPGLQVHAVAGVPVRTIFLDGRPAARVYEDSRARYCAAGGLVPPDARAPRPRQALAALTALERTLGLAGMTPRDLVRTWFYLDDILDWYGDFNAVRRGFFGRNGIRAALAPASTGIGAANPGGTALVLSALAVRPKTRGAAARPVPSPLQGPAPAYGSLFSRAMEPGAPGGRLLVSGTASIGRGGGTVHAGDVNAQLAFTMKVVGAQLAARGMRWADITRAIAYFKRPADIPAFARWLKRTGTAPFPVLAVGGAVCREDLLFELEADAARPVT